MASYNSRLLVPTEEEEIYPYRRVWRSLGLESILLLLIVLGVWVLTSIVGIRIPAALERPVEVALALAPFGLWLVFSLLQERTVPEPRERMLSLVIISALAANAIAIPFIDDFLRVQEWLPLGSAINRIAGYTFTVGIVQVLTCYLVVRYVVWRDGMRIRIDGVAYMLSAAVGYACVQNLHYVFATGATVDIVAMRVFNNTALLYMIAIVVGYGLGEVRFGRPSPLLLTLTMAFGAMLTGIAIPLRSGFSNASLSLSSAFASPIRGLALSVLFLVAVALAIAFLVENAERQAREAEASRD